MPEKSEPTFSVKMELTKTTKGTYVYSSTDPAAGVRSVYVNKNALPNGPKEITLSVVAEG